MGSDIARESKARAVTEKRGDANAAEQVGERVHYCGPVLGCTWPGGSCARSRLSPDRDTAGRRAGSKRTRNMTRGATAVAKRWRGSCRRQRHEGQLWIHDSTAEKGR
jgi:hypothetical protein